jgi:hypothetical protein
MYPDEPSGSVWVHWGGPERVTYFNPADFDIEYPFAISGIRFYFMQHPDCHWDTNQLQYVIYADDGVTQLYRSNFVSLTPPPPEYYDIDEHELDDPVVIEAGGFYYGVAPAGGAHPSSITSSIYIGDHSYYGSPGNWQLFSSETEGIGDYYQAVYLTEPPLPPVDWLTFYPLVPVTLEPGDSAQVEVTIDAGNLEQGDFRTSDLLFICDTGVLPVNVFLSVLASNYGWISGSVSLEDTPYSTGHERDVIVSTDTGVSTHPSRWSPTHAYMLYTLYGNRTVTASLYGYESEHTQIPLLPDSTVTGVDFCLNCVFGAVHGYVYDFYTQEGIQDVNIIGTDSEGHTFTAVTDENGYYCTDRVLEGTYNIEVTHPEYSRKVITNIPRFSQDIDNTVADIVLHPKSDLIPPSDLVASDSLTEGIEVSWVPPSEGEPFEDDFESYADFTLNFPPWTLIDVDGGDTYGIQGITFPHMYEPMAYIIFNPSQTSPPMGNLAHSGSKMAACFNSVLPLYNDDWLITPQLDIGADYQVSFWARSYTVQYKPERFRVGVSTTGTDPSDFSIISSGNYIEAPETWTEYSYDLSSYAGQMVYIGIQCVSYDAFFFLVDDFSVAPASKQTTITFNQVDKVNPHYSRGIGASVENSINKYLSWSGSLPASSRSKQEFLGKYNLYRSQVPDGFFSDFVCIAEELEATTFFDTTVEVDVVYYYAVTALYEPENPEDPYDESPFSNIDPGKQIPPGGIGDGPAILSTRLNPCFPNPFNPDKGGTTISFSLKDRSHVTLSVYNIKGQLVAKLIDDEMNPGIDYQLIWNGKAGNKTLGNGIYFYRLKAGDKTFVKKMVLMR